MHLSSLERPFIVTSTADRSVPEVIRTVKQAELAGARAFEVHLPLVGFPDDDAIARITEATRYPMYATCRRGSFYELLGARDEFDLTDEERTARLLEAVEAGFDGVDVELDTFDPTGGPERFTAETIREYARDPDTDPAEITDDPDAVARQAAFVDRVADAGGETVMSCHTYTHLEPNDAVAIADRAERRGASFAKIVGYDEDMDDLLDSLRAHLELNRSVDVPYALMAIGDVSRILRPVAPMFGSAWVFAQPELTPGGFHSWPLVDNAREVLRRVDWRTAYDPHGRD
ncbi:MAG: type I 3-dehydroquinate dehydratase [Halobacteriaceae archaeon]